MTRILFGGTGGDIAAQISSDGDYEPAAASTFNAYPSFTGGVRITDLLTLAGDVATVVAPVVLADGSVRVMFYGPDAYVGPIWLQDNADPTEPRWLVNPTDMAARLATAATGGGIDLSSATDGQLLVVDSSVPGGIRGATAAVVDYQEVPATLTVPTVTSGTPAYVSTGLEHAVVAGETWLVEGELVYDSSVAAGIDVQIVGIGSVTALPTTAFAHGTLRGPASATTTKQIALLAGTIVAGATAENTVVAGPFSGAGVGVPASVSVKLAVKVGADTTGLMRVRFRPGLDTAAATMHLYQGSWAVFSKAGF